MDRPVVSSVAAAGSARLWRSRGPSVEFAIDRAGLIEAKRCDALSEGAVSRPPRRIRSVVFDTAAADLAKNDIVLRGYALHGASFLEMTWTRPRGERNSIELRAPTLDLCGRLPELSEDLRRSLGDRPLQARCIAETERCERLLETPRARIVIGFDDGFVEAAGRRSPFHEIELRLLDGEAGEFWRFAADLSRRLPLRCLAMGEREIALLRIAGRDISTPKARRPALSPDVSLDDAIAEMLGSCLDQFVANWPALTHSDDPRESIHQMRVALRRLRAGVGLLRRGVSSPALEDAGAHAKTIAAALGKARNLDILEEMLSTGPLAAINGEPSFYALLDAVECRRVKAYAEVEALIAAPETTQFVLDLRAALAQRQWSGLCDGTHPGVDGPADETASLDASAAGSARDFAVLSLDRLHRKAVKKGRDLASSTPERRHEARIALKKSRYAADFFASLFDAGAKARRYLRRSAAIQDVLGAFNDMAVAEQLLREIDEQRDGAVASANRFAIGWCAHAANDTRTDWKKAEKAFGKLKPFWR